MTDIHNHLLYGVDDGAEDEKTMISMLDAAYAQGIRTICATPHYHPGIFGDHREAVREAFGRLKQCAARYDDLKVCLGNELRYSAGCLEWIESGQCLTLNGGRFLLVDFSAHDAAPYIVSSLQKLLNAGYIPVLAHAERYTKLHADCRELIYLKNTGAVIQLDAMSLLGNRSFTEKVRSRRILKKRLADVIASDAHDPEGSTACMLPCRKFVEKKMGQAEAERLFELMPASILSDTN